MNQQFSKLLDMNVKLTNCLIWLPVFMYNEISYMKCRNENRVFVCAEANMKQLYVVSQKTAK